MTVFLLPMIFVCCGSPFPSFDLRFVDQLGSEIHLRHVRNSFYIQNIKGFNPNYKYHHYDITLKIVIGSISKEKCRKIMTIKIWLWNLDKCSRLIKPCLHVQFISWMVIYSCSIVDMTRILILNFMHRF